ncbi:type II toxin-antitoxin system PemK/MazF family toxin [Candidatus Saccharibacteria bacterium]|nr:type II toxin-antitoxin system PemK/MazF family toxin [Candidatus Saccharibacteria bacterium]
MLKTYEKWHKLKFFTNARLLRPKHFKAGEVWWCMVGENIGYEIDGKGDEFLRPVLIIKKFSSGAFFGLPFTSKQKNQKPYYYIIPEAYELGPILFSQGRTYDSVRLKRYKTTIGRRLLSDIRLQYAKYLELL